MKGGYVAMLAAWCFAGGLFFGYMGAQVARSDAAQYRIDVMRVQEQMAESKRLAESALEHAEAVLRRGGCRP